MIRKMNALQTKTLAWMKMLLYLMLVLTFEICTSQDLKLETYIEKTHVSPKAGIRFIFVGRDRLEMGAFYQRHTYIEWKEQSTLPRFHEKEFYGLRLGYPLVTAYNQSYSIKFHVRTGMVNNQNFIITPSITSALQFWKIFNVGVGVGMRAFRPTMIGSLGLRI